MRDLALAGLDRIDHQDDGESLVPGQTRNGTRYVVPRPAEAGDLPDRHALEVGTVGVRVADPLDDRQPPTFGAKSGGTPSSRPSPAGSRSTALPGPSERSRPSSDQ